MLMAVARGTVSGACSAACAPWAAAWAMEAASASLGVPSCCCCAAPSLADGCDTSAVFWLQAAAGHLRSVGLCSRAVDLHIYSCKPFSASSYQLCRAALTWGQTHAFTASPKHREKWTSGVGTPEQTKACPVLSISLHPASWGSRCSAKQALRSHPDTQEVLYDQKGKFYRVAWAEGSGASK